MQVVAAITEVIFAVRLEPVDAAFAAQQLGIVRRTQADSDAGPRCGAGVTIRLDGHGDVR